MLSETDTQQQFTQIYYRNVSSVYRVCYSYMKNKPEAEDMVQDVNANIYLSHFPGK